MPIAAVPEYLDQDFSSASPGMRFGMYLKLWETQWTKSKNRPLDSAKTLNDSDKKRMTAVSDRQKILFDTLAAEASKLSLPAIATAPFTTGLGNEHPLENGFAFLNPYGLPYLPGSGVKGVLRQAARELASGDWGETHDWGSVRPHPESLSPGERDNTSSPYLPRDSDKLPSPSGRGAGGEGISAIDALFGSEDVNTPRRGALSFWDVIPQIKGDSLMVEIMTPHQGHYYQQKLDNKTGNSINPHDSGQPIPIYFLTVPPGSGFTFHVVCDLALLQQSAPALAENNQWRKLLTHAFEHAFNWCGFGAKTAVGYGAMKRDLIAEKHAAEAQATQAAKARLAKLSPNLKKVEEFSQAMAHRCNALNGQKDRQNTEFHQKAQQLAKDARETDSWTPEEKSAAADAIAEWLPKVIEKIDKDAFKKLKLSALRGSV